VRGCGARRGKSFCVVSLPLSPASAGESELKQEIVSFSTTESEYVAATHGMKEALWPSKVFEPIADMTMLFSDNQSAIALMCDHQYHPRTKHINVRYHFISITVRLPIADVVWICPGSSKKSGTTGLSSLE
jgi:hypothetical protein